MRIHWIRENRSNLLKIGWIFDPQFKANLFKSSSWSRIQTESGFVIHDSIQIHGFTRWIHGYTIPWYDSGNLKNRYWPWIIGREKDQFPAADSMSSSVDQLSKMSSLSSFANSVNKWNWKTVNSNKNLPWMNYYIGCFLIIGAHGLKIQEKG